MRKFVVLCCALAVFEVRAEAPLFVPELPRRTLEVPGIDAADVELGLYGGVMNFEDFGASSVMGGRVALHVTERLFLEGALGRGQISDTSFRRLGVPRLDSEFEDVEYRYVSVGYTLFPGETFLGQRRAWVSGAYFQAGLGSTHFIEEEWFTLILGMGIRLLPTDWLAMHFDARIHEFEADLLGTEKANHNMEAHAGVSVFF